MPVAGRDVQQPRPHLHEATPVAQSGEIIRQRYAAQGLHDVQQRLHLQRHSLSLAQSLKAQQLRQQASDARIVAFEGGRAQLAGEFRIAGAECPLFGAPRDQRSFHHGRSSSPAAGPPEARSIKAVHEVV